MTLSMAKVGPMVVFSVMVVFGVMVVPGSVQFKFSQVQSVPKLPVVSTG